MHVTVDKRMAENSNQTLPKESLSSFSHHVCVDDHRTYHIIEFLTIFSAS